MNDEDWHFPRPPSKAGSGSSQHPAPNDGLLEQVLEGKNVQAAWRRVLANDGAPGPDGLAIRDLTPVFHAEWRLVAARLEAGTWEPQPVRRVAIPKPDGGMRMLGIPSVMDRVVHQAISQILGRLWEPQFSPLSFAYRNGRGARQALDSLAAQAAALSAPIACHLDIRQFFDRVPHPLALQAVRHVTTDKRIDDLVAGILAAGACERGQIVPTPLGLPQGSPLSPLLANAVLHSLDTWMSGNRPAPGFVRYADDVLALLPSHCPPDAFLADVESFLRGLGLELNHEKTHSGRLESVSFLGFTFWQDMAGYWRRRISPQSWEALHQQMQRRSSLVWTTFSPDLSTPQDYLTGWSAHYGLTECPLDLERLANLRIRQADRASTSAPCRVRMSYDGSAGATHPHLASRNPPADSSRCGRSSSPGWRQVLQLWWSRFRAGRLLRVGLDFQRTRHRIFPSPSGLRLTVLGFTFRLRF